MKYKEIEKILSRSPLAVAIRSHEKKFGYPPEFGGKTQIGDPILAEEVHKSIAKGEPFIVDAPQFIEHEDGSFTLTAY
jgi:hypothetical protein